MYTPQDIERILRDSAIAEEAYRAKQLELTAPAGRAGKYTAADVEEILRQSAQALPTASELYRDELKRQTSTADAGYQGPTSQGRRSSVFGDSSALSLFGDTLVQSFRDTGSNLANLMRLNLSQPTSNSPVAFAEAYLKYSKDRGLDTSWEDPDGLIQKEVAKQAEREAEAAERIKENIRINQEQHLALQKKYEDLSESEQYIASTLGYGTGQQVPRQLLLQISKLAPGVGELLAYLLLYADVAGGRSAQAISEGATLDQAMSYGALSGGAEVGIELFSGGMGGLGEDGVIPTDKIVAKLAKSNEGRLVLKTAMNAVGEGLEEDASTVLDRFIRYLTFDKNAKPPTLDELKEAFGSAALVSGFLGGVKGIADTTNRTQNGKILRNNLDILIEDGLKTDENSLSHTVASELKDRSAAGKKISNFDVGSLYALNSEKIGRGYAEDLNQRRALANLKKLADAITSAESDSAQNAGGQSAVIDTTAQHFPEARGAIADYKAAINPELVTLSNRVQNSASAGQLKTDAAGRVSSNEKISELKGSPDSFAPQAAQSGGANAQSPWAAELMERAEAYRARTEGAAQTPAELSPARNGREILESPRIAELMKGAEAYRARTEGAAQTPAELSPAQNGREILESPRIAELMQRAEAYRARTEGAAQAAVSQNSQDSYLPDRPSRSITKADRAVSLDLARGEVQNGGVPGLPNARGTRKITKYFDDIQLKTEPNKAYFWSGLGEKGAEIAASIAKKNGGMTLEIVIEAQEIRMPAFDVNNPDTVEAWQKASIVYARQVSGEVRAIMGSNLRPTSIWNTVELPALKNNPNVTKITIIDPDTLAETIIFRR